MKSFLLLIWIFLSCGGFAASEEALNFMPQILVEGGSFTLGLTPEEAKAQFPEFSREAWFDQWSKTMTPHKVTLDSYYIGKYEVTVGQFREFVKQTGYRTSAENSGGGYIFTNGKVIQLPGVDWHNPGIYQTEKHPVTQVSWDDALEFCNWLSEREGLKPAYDLRSRTPVLDWEANGYRIPTEAQWEFAARGGMKSKGFAYSGGANPGVVGWYKANSGGSSHPVGQKSPNELGIYDMSGNVWEWCWDWYAIYGDDPQTEPQGPGFGNYLVNRGGSWRGDPVDLKTPRRDYSSLTFWTYSLGFRVVRPAGVIVP